MKYVNYRKLRNTHIPKVMFIAVTDGTEEIKIL